MNAITRKLPVLCTILLLLLPCFLHAAPPGDPSSWTLTWSDEFNGTSLDPTKWRTTYYDGSRTNNDELEWYVDDPAYHTVSNGILSLMATNTTTPGSSCNGTVCPYTSAMIESDNLFSQMYGYFEASMQIPKGQGLWPAFWLLPYPDTWPPEIDSMENLGNDTTTVYMSNHWTQNYPGINDTGEEGGSVTSPYTGPDFSADFHVFGVLWTPTSIAWYIDGVLRYQVTSYVPIAGYGFTGMYPILNLAVGGSWPGAPNAATVFPAYLQVDYVRVYAGVPPAISGVSVSSITQGGATISWTTDQASDSQVAYGTTANYGSTTRLNATATTAHSQTITGLAAATTYHFSVMSRNGVGNLATSADGTFQTLAAPPTYTITASAGPGGSIFPSGAVAIKSGGSQTFRITPNAGYSISGVTVDGSTAGAVASYTFRNVTANHTITASFAPVSYTLTIRTSGTGTGTVSTNPSGTLFNAGTLVTLTAVPNTNSTFTGWSGACSGTSTTCRLTMNGNKSVTAAFTLRRR